MSTSLVYMCGGLLAAFPLLSLSLLWQRGVEGAGTIAAANALAAFSLLAPGLAGLAPPSACLIVSNLTWICAMAVMYVGVRQFFNLNWHTLRTTILSCLCAFFFALRLYRNEHPSIRGVLFSLYSCIVISVTGIVIFRRMRIEDSGVVLWSLFAVLALVVLNALRACIYGLSLAAPESAQISSAWSSSFVLSESLLVLGLFQALTLIIQTYEAEKR